MMYVVTMISTVINTNHDLIRKYWQNMKSLTETPLAKILH